MNIKLALHKLVSFFFLTALVIISLVSANAQQRTYQDIVKRIDEIDYEINKLTLEKEAIGMEFKGISDFSTRARPILAKHLDYEQKIQSKEEELKNYFWPFEAKKEKEAELQFLVAHRDNNYEEFKNSGGILSFFKVHCNTIEDLHREYNRTADYYLQQKTKYDNISEKLGKLNYEKHDLEVALKYMGDEDDIELDPTGCWRLTFGNYVSEITISKHESGNYIGTLTVNNLDNYVDGQLVFILSRISYNTFRGTEYTWEEKSDGTKKELKIPVIITLNTDNDFITWTSDQTVTMRRCR